MVVEETLAESAVVLRGVDCVDTKVVQGVYVELAVCGGSVNKVY